MKCIYQACMFFFFASWSAWSAHGFHKRKPQTNGCAELKSSGSSAGLCDEATYCSSWMIAEIACTAQWINECPGEEHPSGNNLITFAEACPEYCATACESIDGEYTDNEENNITVAQTGCRFQMEYGNDLFKGTVSADQKVIIPGAPVASIAEGGDLQFRNGWIFRVQGPRSGQLSHSSYNSETSPGEKTTIATAPYNEIGYHKVAAIQNNVAMYGFMKRIVAIHGGSIVDTSASNGAIMEMGKQHAQQYAGHNTYDALINDLVAAPWVHDFHKGAMMQAMDPAMMMSHGCQCSTVVHQLFGTMIRAHGALANDFGHTELTKTLVRAKTKHHLGGTSLFKWSDHPDLVTKFLGTRDVKKRFELLYTYGESEHYTLFFKNQIALSQSYPSLMSYIRSIGTRPFVVLRRNIIDYMICMAKDFCWGSVGETVNANGNKVACGFRGRALYGTNESATVYVKFTAENVLKLIAKEEQYNLDYKSYLDGQLPGSVGKWTFGQFASEDLLGFEYGSAYAGGFDTSLKEWSRLLRSLSIAPKESVIKKVFKDFGTYPAPTKHTNSIYNLNEVKTLLTGTAYLKYLRL